MSRMVSKCTPENCLPLENGGLKSGPNFTPKFGLGGFSPPHQSEARTEGPLDYRWAGKTSVKADPLYSRERNIISEVRIMMNICEDLRKKIRDKPLKEKVKECERLENVPSENVPSFQIWERKEQIPGKGPNSHWKTEQRRGSALSDRSFTPSP